MVRGLSVRNSDEAEDVAKKYLIERYGYTNIEFQSVDFDGNFFLLEGTIKGDNNDEVIFTFTVKISKDRNVVGWKVV